VVHAAFVDYAAAVLPAQPQPVLALGIDETRRGARAAAAMCAHEVRLVAAEESRHGRVNWLHRGPEIGPPNGQFELITRNFLRTLCGPEGVIPPLICGNVSIHTLKRKSTTSPSAIM